MFLMWPMKLTESTNICCTSDRLVCTIKVNIKERLIGNDKCFCGKWNAVRE